MSETAEVSSSRRKCVLQTPHCRTFSVPLEDDIRTSASGPKLELRLQSRLSNLQIGLLGPRLLHERLGRASTIMPRPSFLILDFG